MDGREKCKILKQFRAQIAKENGIEGFEYKDCPNKGPCSGTCPACDEETENLELALREKKVYQRLPRYMDMPEELVNVLEYSVYRDMKELCHPWLMERSDYDRIPGGRIVTPNHEKTIKANEAAERQWKERRNVMGYFQTPRIDFAQLEKEAGEKEKAMRRQEKLDKSMIGKVRGLLNKKKDGGKK